MNSLKLGVIGVGWVGAQLKRYFEEFKGYKAGEDLMLYDIDPAKCAGDINLADVVFVAVPTPRDPKTGGCDTSIVEDAASKIKGEKIVVLKSTITPGTTEKLQQRYPQHKFLFNPEFLSEKTAWSDMLHPDRQIVGFTEKSMDAAHLVLSLLPRAPFMSPWGVNTYKHTRISATEAEIIKYAGNVYFSQKVNWANALARVSEKMGANYENVRQGMSADHRIGDSHLDVTHGGYRGFGGYCFPKDTSAFMTFAKENGLEDVHNLLMAAWKFNENLLAEQGLTYDDVSKHISDLEALEKKKKAQENKN
ncbi:MAG: UDP-glucose/GDP-mannose dehydrogenase family [Parcubacteria group bacterium Gr01-1014_19]|nr:MAG: UDP-glucose/GDP-mannose dehydrogenase family [Parcubacteria group bacterium Gr01-1014_19]